ncbi:MAG: IS1380 family transposase [Streptosporangiaceae bacterium]
MRLLHALAKTSACFDDPNLVSHAGLVPLMALAERAGLHDLAVGVRPDDPAGANPALKIAALAAGMAAGADSIDDMDLLRHGATARIFGGVQTPSTPGSFLRSFTWGNVSQLQRTHREILVSLCRIAPVLPGAETLAFIDVDATQNRVYGYQKQGARYGHTKIASKSVLVKGLNVLAGIISTPLSAPVIAATRLRGGSAASTRGAASLITETIATARRCGCAGTIVVRLDSGFYNSAVTRAIVKAGAHFSVTVAMNSHVRNAIAAIGEDAWTPIRYPRAIFDEQAGGWVSDAEIAEIQYAAFTSKKKEEQVTARLTVRRVKALNTKAAEGQGELFPAWRYHGVFANSPYLMIQAEDQHRDHAIVEQVFADWNAGPLAHMPSGQFSANAAWTAIAAISQNLLRAAGVLAGPLLARARTATIRRDIIAVAARIARRGRGNIALHLPEGHHREHEWTTLWTKTAAGLHAGAGPPAAAA